MSNDRAARILVGVDGSPQAMESCRRAVALATLFGASLTALHVATPVSRDSLSRWAHEDAEASSRALGERVLEEARALARGFAPFTGEVVFGEPSDVIVRRARELGADLVVVGTRGLGAVDRLLLGSVSSAVVQRAPCLVLVVRSRHSGNATR